MEFHVNCPMCSGRWSIELSEDQERRFFEYKSSGKLIQDALPDLNAVEREFLKSGYCPECQKEIFDCDETDKIHKVKEVKW